jgi:hypothetical protein
MALKDWVRSEGYIDSVSGAYSTPYRSDNDFIMLVRDIQFQDVKGGGYTSFPTLYDVASANRGRTYIPITDNTKLIQDPPNPKAIRKY